MSGSGNSRRKQFRRQSSIILYKQRGRKKSVTTENDEAENDELQNCRTTVTTENGKVENDEQQGRYTVVTENGKVENDEQQGRYTVVTENGKVENDEQQSRSSVTTYNYKAKNCNQHLRSSVTKNQHQVEKDEQQDRISGSTNNYQVEDDEQQSRSSVTTNNYGANNCNQQSRISVTTNQCQVKNDEQQDRSSDTKNNYQVEDDEQFRVVVARWRLMTWDGPWPRRPEPNDNQQARSSVTTNNKGTENYNQQARSSVAPNNNYEVENDEQQRRSSVTTDNYEFENDKQPARSSFTTNNYEFENDKEPARSSVVNNNYDEQQHRSSVATNNYEFENDKQHRRSSVMTDNYKLENDKEPARSFVTTNNHEVASDEQQDRSSDTTNNHELENDEQQHRYSVTANNCEVENDEQQYIRSVTPDNYEFEHYKQQDVSSVMINNYKADNTQARSSVRTKFLEAEKGRSPLTVTFRTFLSSVASENFEAKNYSGRRMSESESSFRSFVSWGSTKDYKSECDDDISVVAENEDPDYDGIFVQIQTSQIMGSIQLGIQHAVGGLASKPERDLLMQDFMTVETTVFAADGSSQTPAHHYSEFTFKTYAPIAFRYFRDLFGIQPDDFLISFCSSSLRELSNPGASGSIFYLTADDEFIIKTVQHKEGEFLQKLLPGYYMNLNQNPRTLLPKFFGLYCYQCNHKNIRMVAMNNLLPSVVTLHQKYDLKGSTYKRKANKSERSKKSPTFKDLDFMEHHPEGIFLEADTYTALVSTIRRDCRVLESFKIMDYSLLVGVHNLDQDSRESKAGRDSDNEQQASDNRGLSRNKSINRHKLVAHSTAMESIQAESQPIDHQGDVPPGGIPARSAKGERLLLYLGIIDILQSYRLKKKLEHTWKSILHDGDSVSVHRPGFYAQRFQEFMSSKVFKKIPSPLKHSPSKRKSISRPMRSQDSTDVDTTGSPEGAVSPSYPSVLKDKAGGAAPPSTKGAPPPVPPRGLPRKHNTGLVVKSPLRATHSESESMKTESKTHPRAEQSLSASSDLSPLRVALQKSNRFSSQQMPNLRTNNKRILGFPSSSTPPPSFEDAIRSSDSHIDNTSSPRHRPASRHSTSEMVATKQVVTFHEEHVSVSEVRLECRSDKSTLSVESGGSTVGGRHFEGSTPTWTEGTPSFTESSSSGDMGFPMTPVKGMGYEKDANIKAISEDNSLSEVR